MGNPITKTCRALNPGFSAAGFIPMSAGKVLAKFPFIKRKSGKNGIRTVVPGRGCIRSEKRYCVLEKILIGETK